MPRRRDFPPRVCVGCSREFVPRTRETRFCSGPCGSRSTAAARRLTTTRLGRVCSVCGAVYNATYSGQRTCGRDCGMKLWRANQGYEGESPRHTRTCICGRVFRSTVGAGLCTGCRPRAPVRRRPHFGDLLTVVCSCGNAFDFVYAAGRTRTTCDECKRSARREQKKRQNASDAGRARKRTARRRRKARERGAVTERYTLAEIAARDKFICHLCTRRVAMTKVVPHPKSPTIDHLLPLADGGDDVRANVRLAHFICNSLRGAGGIVQLALIG